MFDYGSTCLCMLFLILVDTILHAMATHIGDLTISYLFLGALAVTRLLILSVAFKLVWDTVLFRFGLVGLLCSHLRIFALTFPVSSVLSIATCAYRGVLLGDGYDRRSLWKKGIFRALHYLDYAGCILCYSSIIYTVILLGDPKYYKSTEWVRKSQKR
mmetsp:Transcript_9492/g.14245  ORF Transcript_9492/g.14245 Transcript_9492/m.14245 type:complete len:158 (-) Transcript_9492:341-814(-)